MGKWRVYMEIYAFASIWPIMGVGAMWGCWRALLWSYGGREGFRRAVIQEPHEDEWFQANPRQIMYRDSPLANVPHHIVDKPDGHAMAHNHHENY
jgi:hypothetical protein